MELLKSEIDFNGVYRVKENSAQTLMIAMNWHNYSRLWGTPTAIAADCSKKNQIISKKCARGRFRADYSALCESYRDVFIYSRLSVHYRTTDALALFSFLTFHHSKSTNLALGITSLK